MKLKTRVKKFFTLSRLILLGIIFLSIFFRFWQLTQRAGFEADQETAAFMAKQILLDRKPTLLGAITSSGNIFLGPLYFYLYTIPMIFTGFNPAGQLFLSSLTGVATTAAFYFLGAKMFNRGVGLIAAFLHAVSLIFSGAERPAWNVSQILLIYLFIYYCYFQISLGMKKYWLYLVALIGLVLNFHFTGIFFIPATVLYFLYLAIVSKKINKQDIFYLSGGLLLFILFLLPLIIFDLRHNFLNSKNILEFFLTGESSGREVLAKIPYSLKDEFYVLSGIFLLPGFFSALLFLFSFQTLAQKYGQFFVAVLILYITASFGFAIFNGRITSYYYLLFFPPLVLGFSLFLVSLSRKNRSFKSLVLIFLIFLLSVNTKEFLAQKTSFSLATKEKVVNFIVAKAGGKPYSVSYSVDYSRNFGFKYLFWQSGYSPREQLKPPIYTIVLPDNYGGIKPDLKIDDIGIVLPVNKL